jgi:ClpX C4-type zinc finger
MSPGSTGEKEMHIQLPGDPGRCSFCGKPRSPDGLLYYGRNGAAICPNCVGRVALAFERRLGREWYRARSNSGD